jgi:hypothetical protein
LRDARFLMPESHHIPSPREIDLLQRRRRFLVAREQVAQDSIRYRAIREMRQWPASRSGTVDGHADGRLPAR